MTYVLDGFGFEAQPFRRENNRRIVKHEISNSNTVYLQDTGRDINDISIVAILDVSERNTLLAQSNSSGVKVFSDTRTGITSLGVRIAGYSEEEIYPDTWRIEIVLRPTTTY